MPAPTPHYQYNRLAATTASTGAVTSYDFVGSWVRIFNPSTADVFINFKGESASTSDPMLESSGKIEGLVPAFTGLALRATSTGPVAGTGNIVHVTAMGSG